ncbi:MAG TPA: type I-U CRISPR-associated helicase/endonuclease Cas3 [Actinomycetota bacterium]|nr:type I-U CRISPR-associated helicase/endonuclease Cas3 [Actinomycetota bacterium]
MGDIPDFPSFYRALHAGQDPLPWQARLAELVVREGWPTEIGVPTGLGKTACLDIAIWSLAWQAATLGADRFAPTRIWYVVNRRLLVDATYNRAVAIARLLAAPDSIDVAWPSATDADRSAVAQVAAALRALAAVGSSPGPLHLTRLRGGAELGARVPDPSQPALIFATVPMFASRWLFRGYGSSTSMRPVDAALAGVDSLVLLDEAHIAANLQTLAARGGPVELCDLGDPTRVLPPERARPRLVALTATGRTGDVFRLDAHDRENGVVRQRLGASKLASTASCAQKDLAKTLAERAVACLDGQERKSCVVFANTPLTARKVYDELERRAVRPKGSDTASELLLLTGRFREREGARVRSRVLDETYGAPAGRQGPREHDLIVVATQTLEVGADLDFDCLVTESAGARAIVQRFGRLNRLGLRENSEAVVVHPEEKEPSSIYGVEAEAVWQRIAAAAAGGTVDMCPERIVEVVGVPADIPKRVGELLPNHLWEWAKTTEPPQGEASSELFYEGVEKEGRISVLWRAHLPEPGVRLVPPAHEHESVEIPIGELRDALTDLTTGDLHRLTPDRASVEVVSDLRALRPGDTVVLRPETGLYDELGWNVSSKQTVLDVSPLDGPTLTLDDAIISNLIPGWGDDLKEVVRSLRAEDGVPLETKDEEALVTELLDQLSGDQPWHSWLDNQELDAFRGGLSTTVARPADDDPFLKPKRRDRPQVQLRSDAFDELSFDRARGTELGEHLRLVGDFSARMAGRIGCPAKLVEAVRLAGALHDIGKADPRFQRWLDPGREGGSLLAKSATPGERIEAYRRAAGWPRGGRHEQLSGRLAAAVLRDLDSGVDDDLVLHLVISHHGQGRPFVRLVADASEGTVSFRDNGAAVMVASNLALPDWQQPARFRRLCKRYGYWGLALLEAIVRQADHAVSQQGSTDAEGVI